MVFEDGVTPAQLDYLKRCIASGNTDDIGWTTHFTPEMARDLAKYLLEAADICAYLNETGQNAEIVAKTYDESGSS